MPKLKMNVPHPLEKKEAAERIKTYLDKLKRKFGDQVSDLNEEWVDENTVKFGFTTYGFKVAGQMAVEENQVAIDTDIPLAAMMFKGKIEQQVRENLDKLLA